VWYTNYNKEDDMSFDKLPIGELRRLADDVYPVELSEEESKDKKKAAEALNAVGANWGQYLRLHAPDDVKEKYAADLNAELDNENVTQPNVITSADVTGKVEETGEVRIITKEAPKVTEKYLVKMTRANPLFQVGPYKFTKEHPYALVEGSDLRKLLDEEEGFRQAYPDEIDEFYN
jgi:hypothetical protein